jgi:hypothetical protein
LIDDIVEILLGPGQIIGEDIALASRLMNQNPR